MNNNYRKFINSCVKYMHKMRKENIPLEIQKILLKEYISTYIIDNNK